MAVEFQARHHVDVTETGVGYDFAHVLLGEASSWSGRREAIKGDGGFVVEVVLVAFPASHQVDLAFDIGDAEERALAHVNHGAAIGQGGPVFDLGFWEGSPLDHLAEGLYSVVNAGRGSGFYFCRFGGYR